VVAKCIALMVAEVPTYQGTMIKTIGDEIMCTFPDAGLALQAACRMQLAVEAGRPGSNVPLYVHIGFHYGPVICEDGDVYGDTVNVAARVTELTRAREITTTQDTVERLPLELKSKVRQIFRGGIRGKQQELAMFRVSWELDDTLSTRVGMPTERRPNAGQAELQLRYRDQVYRLDEQCRSLVLGRGQDCSIVIHDDLASRQHARVEYRFGKFVLVDHSVNGTYLRFRDGQVIRLAQEETILHGSGSISLGRPFGEATDTAEFLVQ
jgi:adenylate cyclase